MRLTVNQTWMLAGYCRKSRRHECLTGSTAVTVCLYRQIFSWSHIRASGGSRPGLLICVLMSGWTQAELFPAAGGISHWKMRHHGKFVFFLCAGEKKLKQDYLLKQHKSFYFDGIFYHHSHGVSVSQCLGISSCILRWRPEHFIYDFYKGEDRTRGHMATWLIKTEFQQKEKEQKDIENCLAWKKHGIWPNRLYA